MKTKISKIIALLVALLLVVIIIPSNVLGKGTKYTLEDLVAKIINLESQVSILRTQVADLNALVGSSGPVEDGTVLHVYPSQPFVWTQFDFSSTIPSVQISIDSIDAKVFNMSFAEVASDYEAQFNLRYISGYRKYRVDINVFGSINPVVGSIDQDPCNIIYIHFSGENEEVYSIEGMVDELGNMNVFGSIYSNSIPKLVFSRATLACLGGMH
jgi:hypothetical protein